MYTDININFSKLPLELVQTVSIYNTWAKIAVCRLLHNHSHLLFCSVELENPLVQSANTTPERESGKCWIDYSLGSQILHWSVGQGAPLPCSQAVQNSGMRVSSAQQTISSLEARSFIYTIPFSRWIAEGWVCFGGWWITPTLSQFNKVENMNETALLIAWAGSAGGLKNQEWNTGLGIQLGTGNIWNRAPGWCDPGNLKWAICFLSHLEPLSKVSDFIT